MSTTSIFFAILLLINVPTVSSAPIVSDQKEATDSNAYKNDVISPYLNRAVRLVDFSSPYKVDDDADLPSESDIFYVFGKYSDVTDDRKSSGL
ncbi:unnamed protein product [Caenorhabditis brenneri]